MRYVSFLLLTRLYNYNLFLYFFGLFKSWGFHHSKGLNCCSIEFEGESLNRAELRQCEDKLYLIGHVFLLFHFYSAAETKMEVPKTVFILVAMIISAGWYIRK